LETPAGSASRNRNFSLFFFLPPSLFFFQTPHCLKACSGAGGGNGKHEACRGRPCFPFFFSFSLPPSPRLQSPGNDRIIALVQTGGTPEVKNLFFFPFPLLFRYSITGWARQLDVHGVIHPEAPSPSLPLPPFFFFPANRYPLCRTLEKSGWRVLGGWKLVERLFFFFFFFFPPPPSPSTRRLQGDSKRFLTA